ncbi:MAG: ammonia-forming cytochrome c nitrite reductase subunit c552 [Bacteroidetes bacterium]|nr:ammonia-forming cytochrome c nitrite reductase subunit c552 [Bacteroidota bacterium]
MFLNDFEGAFCLVKIPDKWKTSGHANHFKSGINGLLGSYYGSSCFKCHTVGYDHNSVAANDGFDDRATAAGWTFFSPPGPTKWDSLKAKSAALTQFASIGCENCHGPGSEHTMGGDKAKINISLNAGVCGQCHDEPWRHNRYAQWENSLHSHAVWSNSFAQGATSQNNSLGNCIRCHDAQGFVNFTKGSTTNTTGWTEARHQKIGCSTCHDPHSGHTRTTPAVADTLANGFKYTVGGKGMLCMSCHKARRDAKTYAITSVSSSHWGPHYSVESDVLLGQNAADFGTPFISGNHKNAVKDGCVQCHMVATVDTGNVNRDKVGQHSFRLLNEATGFEHVESCKDCHGSNIKSFKDFIAAADFDGNGAIEDIQSEVKGLLKKLKKALPPVGSEEVDWTKVRDYKGADSLNMRKAYYNYKIMVDDNSYGMHNAKFSIDVLRKSAAILTGVEFENNDVPQTFELSQNYPNPFNPSTEIKFSVAKSENIKIAIYDAVGRVVKVMVNEMLSPGNYKLTWNGENTNGSKVVSGIYFYRFESSSFEATKKMVLLK